MIVKLMRNKISNKMKILSELLEGRKSTAQLCRALGYVKDEKPQYNILEKDLNTLYSLKMLSKRKEKTGGRPGTFWRIKEDIPNLKRLWVDYPGLRDTMRFSDYFLNVLPLLIKSVKEQAIRNFTGYQAYQRTLEVKDEIALFMLLPFNPPLIEFILNEGLIKKRKKFEEYYMKSVDISQGIKKKLQEVLNCPVGSQIKKVNYSIFFSKMMEFFLVESEILDRYQKTLSEDIPEFTIKLRIKCENIYFVPGENMSDIPDVNPLPSPGW